MKPSYFDIDELPLKCQGVLDELCEEEELRQLQRGIERLTSEHRELLDLRFEKNLSVAVIADAKGVSRQAMNCRLHRIVDNLREMMR